MKEMLTPDSFIKQSVLAILDDFKAVSGLSISRTKTELMIDGGCSDRCRVMAEAVGITQGALPVRYLGVPLTSKKMTVRLSTSFG